MELTWDNTKLWQDKANEHKGEDEEPTWSWDCGFKLDFDGPLLTMSSRFYPPHKNVGDFWQGDVQIFLMEEQISSKHFQCEKLDELKEKVELYAKEYIEFLRSRIISSFNDLAFSLTQPKPPTPPH